MDHEVETPTSSMRGILAVAQQVHQRELDKRDEQVKELQLENQKLKQECSALQQKCAELRRASIEDKGHMISTNQHYEHRLASMDIHVKELEAELMRVQKTHDLELAHLETERDKANHIIKTLLDKVSQSRAN